MNRRLWTPMALIFAITGLAAFSDARADNVCSTSPSVISYSCVYGRAYLIVNGGVYFNGASVSVPRGTSIQAAGNGIIPNTRILFEFRNPIGTVAYSRLTQNARSNCVVHQEAETFSTTVLAPGTYHVYASLWAANTGELPGYPFGWPYCRPGDFVAYLTVY
jgi:hypothetical protein